MARPTVKNTIDIQNWWVESGTHDENDRPVTWCVYGGLDERGYSRYIAEFESKTLADHVARIHNSLKASRSSRQGIG